MRFKNNFSKFKNTTVFEAKHITLDLKRFQNGINTMSTMIEQLDDDFQVLKVLEVEPYLELLFYKEKIDFNIYRIEVDAYVGFENLSSKKYVKSITSTIDTSDEQYEHFKKVATSHFFSELDEIEHFVQIFFEEEIIKKVLSEVYDLKSQLSDFTSHNFTTILNKYLKISEELRSKKAPTEHMTLEEFIIVNNLIQKLVETNECFPMFLYIED